MRPVTTSDELDAALSAPVALVYKHSTRCPVSTAAYHEVQALLRGRPDAPVWLVDVIGQRRLSMEVEGRTGVVHESPQAIVLAAGEVLWDASHFEVTAEALGRALDRAEAGARG